MYAGHARKAGDCAEKKRIEALDREVRDLRNLRKANKIPRLVSAFFGQAELDRRFKL
jgi:hypothetical protein